MSKKRNIASGRDIQDNNQEIEAVAFQFAFSGHISYLLPLQAPINPVDFLMKSVFDCKSNRLCWSLFAEQ